MTSPVDDPYKYGSGPITHTQGYAPLSADPFGIAPFVVPEEADVAAVATDAPPPASDPAVPVDPAVEPQKES
jgi:hypothetical protein